MIKTAIAKSPTHGKFLSYICQAPAWDGKSHFRFSVDLEKAVNIPVESMRYLSASFHQTYPNALPLEFIRAD